MGSKVDELGRVLFTGPVRAAHFVIVRGEREQSAEALASALLASMKRVGLLRDGLLVVP